MDREQKKTFLTNHFVFDTLSDGDIGLLLDNTHSKKYVADEVIFFKGDPTTGMMAVVSGCVQIRIVSEDGKQLVLNTMREGEMLGEIGVLDGGDRTADAVAVEPTELLTIDRRAFLDLINRIPDFSMTLMEILCSRIRGTSEQAEDLALLDLKNGWPRNSSAWPGKSPPARTAARPLSAIRNRTWPRWSGSRGKASTSTWAPGPRTG